MDKYVPCDQLYVFYCLWSDFTRLTYCKESIQAGMASSQENITHGSIGSLFSDSFIKSIVIRYGKMSLINDPRVSNRLMTLIRHI